MSQSQVSSRFMAHILAQEETELKNRQNSEAVENEDYALADSLKKEINQLKSKMLTGKDLKQML